MKLDFYWMNQAIAYWGIVLFIVPQKYLKRLFLYGLLGGFLYTCIVQYVAVALLKRWTFSTDILTIIGIPFFFAVSWFAVTILYGYLLINYSRFQFYILSFFVLWATIMNYSAVYFNKLTMTNWTLVETLMFATFSHVILLYFLKYLFKIDTLGANEDLLLLKSRK